MKEEAEVALHHDAKLWWPQGNTLWSWRPVCSSAAQTKMALHSVILACMKRRDFCERVSEYFVHEIKDSKVEEHNQFLK